MKFKLDENFGQRTINIFKEAGHDAHTVHEEGLNGASDLRIYDLCQKERRCLVTLDLDFSDAMRFQAQSTGGIIVIRLPRNPNLSTLESLVRQCLQMLEQTRAEGQLWIVEPGRIRIHQTNNTEE
jgi:predicted nuclease of predicted toxin-antitoxin system